MHRDRGWQMVGYHHVIRLDGVVEQDRPDTMVGATVTAALCALLLVANGCQTTAPASECDEWKRLTPSANTRTFTIANDQPFAEAVADHNTFGQERGCWQAIEGLGIE
jgi:hypothetical protein